MGGEGRGDVLSEWTYGYFSISGRTSEQAARTTADLVTPRRRATFAPGMGRSLLYKSGNRSLWTFPA
jgi:hypothetical protein